METGGSVRVLGLFGYGKRMSVLGVLIVEVTLMCFFKLYVILLLVQLATLQGLHI